MESVDTYLGLVTSYHRPAARFTDMLARLVEPLVGVQTVLAATPQAYDLDAAAGAQLDVDGEWVGRSRFVATPLPDPWFRFDEEKRGLDRGVWREPFESAEGVTGLDDETYRTLLRAKIAANGWDGTIEGARDALAIVFAPTATRIILQDNHDMTAIFGVAGVIPPPVFLALLAKGYLPLKPHGVRISYVVPSVDGAPLFGFDMQTADIAGFDTGAFAQDVNDYLNS
ncbi:DUF2612 domain-containing protein [Salinarimonas soli]|uniref:DUF2612 domain-containing protein n=1 Tax=Salinarimonas soli TaxID=1638099 RepID=A0A5B2VEW5_9HYPH|nr:DUF2612 domain-containing protein [Salinarimonas soli]KAA2237661.1 DUF2612 domain-containing protein [Salinarimonas soli]